MAATVQSMQRVPTPPSAPKTPLKSEQAMVPSDEKEKLPELRTSDMAVDKTKPLPTSLQSDFLPEDVLFALTQVPQSKDLLGPLTRQRNLSTSTTSSRPPPAGVWNHNRRDKFKHLTQNTPCSCGAGKDISFLYDVPKREGSLKRPEKSDKSAVRKDATELQNKVLQLPDTLIPEEYHVVKNKGVMGIEFHEDKYSNQVEDHEKHLVVFPSMKPASRFEVVQLQKTMADMLERAGVNDCDIEIKGPTQMHNLLELIKKEQNIYNLVFHEIIRQASIECVERGELLSDLRGKYSELLSKVPKQIKSLHEEVMAQRALDRRLTEELMRFKSTISVLTSELSEVKEHDERVTKEAQQAQEDLKAALTEAQKNASLLAEYHELYELQRRRLDNQVFMLSEERELWSTAAYSLAMKVTEEAQLTTAKRLHISEKAWVKLANHFTILLSDKDTDYLTKISGFMEKWRDMMEEFSITLKHREEEMRQQLRHLAPGIDRWLKDLRKCFTKDGQFLKCPEKQQQQEFLTELRKWEEVLGKETEKFGGDMLLSGQEQLETIRQQMHGWTDAAMRVFSRHRGSEGSVNKDQVAMLRLNEEVDDLLHQFNTRLTGENGVATNVIHLMNGMETWDMKIASGLNGTMPVHDTEWAGLCLLMEDWLVSIEEAIEYVGSTQREESRAEGRPHTRVHSQTPGKAVTAETEYEWTLGVDVTECVRKVQKWVTTATNAVDSEDAKMCEQVSTLHSQMVRWMVQVLLRLAPDKEGNSKEAREMALLGSSTLNQLHANAQTLFEQLETFSSHVSSCCSGIVMDNTQRRRDQLEENADHELKDLQRLQSECYDWVKTAKILTSQLLGEPVDTLFVPTVIKDTGKREVKLTRPSSPQYVDREKLETAEQQEETKPPKEEDEEKPAPEFDEDQGEEEEAGEITQEQAETEGGTQAPEPPKEPAKEDEDNIEVIGGDDNTHKTKIQDAQDQPLAPGSSIPQLPPDQVPNTGKAFEALQAVASLQQQLLATEERAQSAEEKVSISEAELNVCLERIRSMAKRIAELEHDTGGKQDEKQKKDEPKPSTPKTPRTPGGTVVTPKETKDSDKKRPESTASKSSKGSSRGKKK